MMPRDAYDCDGFTGWRRADLYSPKMDPEGTSTHILTRSGNDYFGRISP
jgi:hypothetical protein